MRILRVEFTSDVHAIIVLRPSLMARLLGARDVVVELAMVDGNWFGRYSRRGIGYMPHSALLWQALEFQPVTEVPQARMLLEPGVSNG